MREINGYILSLLIVSAAAGLMGMLSPDEGSVSRSIKYIISLGITITMLAPLSDVIYALPGMIEEITAESAPESEVTLPHGLYSEMSAQSAEAITDALEKEIETRYGVNSHIKLELDTSDYSSIRILSAEVRINKSDSLYIDLITKLIENTLCCETEWTVIE